MAWVKSSFRMSREARFGDRYPAVRRKPDEACVYCGERSTCQDHVPALYHTGRLSVAEWLELGVVHCLVPSCTSCNTLLGVHPLHTVSTRAGYLLDLFERRVADQLELIALCEARGADSLQGCPLSEIRARLVEFEGRLASLRSRWCWSREA